MNLLNFYIPEWFFVALNLIILIFALQKLLWKPVNKILEDRQAKVIKTGEDAEEAATLRAEMEQLRAQVDTDVEQRTLELMKEARSRAGREYDRIVADAEKKADLILSAANVKAQQEQDRLAVEFKKQIAAVALEAAGFLMRSTMDTEQNKRLVEAFLAEKDVSA